MSSSALEQRHGSVLNVTAWTLGPLALFVAVFRAIDFLHVPQPAARWLGALALLTACIGQSMAFTKSRAIVKGQSVAVRWGGYFCTFVSCILLFFWIAWLAVASYYVIHPNAPPLFGGH